MNPDLIYGSEPLKEEGDGSENRNKLTAPIRLRVAVDADIPLFRILTERRRVIFSVEICNLVEYNLCKY